MALSPDEISRRAFTPSADGYHQGEVRAFLAKVGAERRALLAMFPQGQQQAAELLVAIASHEQRLAMIEQRLAAVLHRLEATATAIDGTQAATMAPSGALRRVGAGPESLPVIDPPPAATHAGPSSTDEMGDNSDEPAHPGEPTSIPLVKQTTPIPDRPTIEAPMDRSAPASQGGHVDEAEEADAVGATLASQHEPPDPLAATAGPLGHEPPDPLAAQTAADAGLEPLQPVGTTATSSPGPNGSPVAAARAAAGRTADDPSSTAGGQPALGDDTADMAAAPAPLLPPPPLPPTTSSTAGPSPLPSPLPPPPAAPTPSLPPPPTPATPTVEPPVEATAQPSLLGSIDATTPLISDKTKSLLDGVLDDVMGNLTERNDTP